MPDFQFGSVLHEMLFVVSLYAFMRANYIIVREGREANVGQGMRIMAVVYSVVFGFYAIAGLLTVTGIAQTLK